MTDYEKKQEMHQMETKLGLGVMLSMLCFVSAHAFGAESMAGIVSDPPASNSPNVLYAMYAQVLNNPASLFVIGFLCVICWLMDDLPFINSRYIVHYSSVIGGSIFWAFTSIDTVPKSFPHPFAVFICEGIVCGFIAFFAHKFIVAKLIGWCSGKPADAQPQSKQQDAKA